MRVPLAAVVAALVPVQMAQRRDHSVIGEKIAFPSTRGLTGKLILGSAIFGVGWGLTGLCPGPSFASLAGDTWHGWLFFSSMVVGMCCFEVWQIARSRAVARVQENRGSS